MKTMDIRSQPSLSFRSTIFASAGFMMLFILFFQGSLFASEALPLSDILQRVQQRYKASYFEADFVQESYLKAADVVDTATGHVYFKRPDMMRWHYKMPQEHLIVTDGKTVWIYRQAENQVMFGKAAGYFGTTKGLDVLADPDLLRKDFIVKMAPEQFQEPDRYVLQLVPKAKRSDLSKLFLSISKRSFDIASLVRYNPFGDKTTIRFTKLKFGQGLDSSLFVFEPPRGADLIPLDTH